MEPEQWQQQQQSLDNLKKFFLSFEQMKFLPGAKLVATINGNELKVDNYTLRIRSVGHWPKAKKITLKMTLQGWEKLALA